MNINERYFSEVLNNLLCDNIVVFEFGTASGNCLAAIIKVLLDSGKNIKQVVSFDSFLGLPEEENGVPKSKDWFKGAFNLLYENNTSKEVNEKAKTQEEALTILKKRFQQYDFVRFVEGFYSDSLNKDTIKKYNIQPANFIHVDCDLYISAKQALEFCIQNNLLAEGCLIEYNDWGGTQEGIGGESKAHYEMARKYNLQFETIRKSTTALFRYKSIK